MSAMSTFRYQISLVHVLEQDTALLRTKLLPPPPLHALLQRCIEHVVHSLAGFGRAFHIPGVDIPRDGHALLLRNGSLALGTQHSSSLLVGSQIDFGCN